MCCLAIYKTIKYSFRCRAEVPLLSGDLIQLKLKYCIERFEAMRNCSFTWVCKQNTGNIIDEILNAAIDAERTFKYSQP